MSPNMTGTFFETFRGEGERGGCDDSLAARERLLGGENSRRDGGCGGECGGECDEGDYENDDLDDECGGECDDENDDLDGECDKNDDFDVNVMMNMIKCDECDDGRDDET